MKRPPNSHNSAPASTRPLAAVFPACSAPSRSTLASIYSVRPTPRATVSTPVTWKELRTVEIDDFTLRNVPARVRKLGDLWAPVAAAEDDPARYDLGRFVRA